MHVQSILSYTELTQRLDTFFDKKMRDGQHRIYLLEPKYLQLFPQLQAEYIVQYKNELIFVKPKKVKIYNARIF